jgi:Tol biopolymer transport system component
VATITTPPPPQRDDLEALIEEARRRQRRRQRRIGASLLLVALTAGVLVYLVVGRGNGTGPHAPTAPRTAPRPAAPPEIVFAASRAAVLLGEIYRVGLDGRSVNLSHSDAADVAPTLSPDGKWLAFLSGRGGYAAVYVVGLRGGRPERISPKLFSDRYRIDGQIFWSSDSRHLAADVSGAETAIWIGGLNRRGTLVGHRPAGQTAIFPDRRLLAYTVQHQTLVLGVPGGAGAHYKYSDELRVTDASGRRVWHAAGGGVRALSWSKTGRLAVVAGDEIRVYDEQGHRLDAFPGRQFAWSPSGDQLASIWHGKLELRSDGIGPVVSSFDARAVLAWPLAKHILIWKGTVTAALDPSTGRLSPLPQSACCTPAFSPDASHIAFPAPTYDPVSLKVAKPDGSEARTLVRRPACPGSAQFSGLQFTPDGRGVIYQASCAEPPANLYTVAADGTRLRRITRGVSDHGGPSLSPDKRWIAFAKSPAPAVCEKGCSAAIWLMDLAGRHARQLTYPRDLEYDAGPSWSPDGKRIVFSESSATAPTTLVLAAATGRSIRPLHVAGFHPAWGPRRIAYLDENFGGIWTVRPDGSGKQKVATGRRISSLAWSRDRRLAYLSNDGTTVNVLGKTSFRLSLKATELTWSPDGERLLLSASKGHAYSELYTLDLRTRSLRQITFGLGDIHGASWR